jgi:transposase-like protein
MDLAERGADLRRRIAEERPEPVGGSRFPAELRGEVEAYLRDRLAEGGTVHAVAKEVGVWQSTLRHWLSGVSGDPAAPALRPVSVVPSRRQPPRPSPAAIFVHGPRGLRIEGLDLEGVAELLRRLG